MTYTEAALVYIGDASSQVYEFLRRPRPCIFLNFEQVDWRDRENYSHWHLGQVIERDRSARSGAGPGRRNAAAIRGRPARGVRVLNRSLARTCVGAAGKSDPRVRAGRTGPGTSSQPNERAGNSLCPRSAGQRSRYQRHRVGAAIGRGTRDNPVRGLRHRPEPRDRCFAGAACGVERWPRAARRANVSRPPICGG